MAKLNLAAKLKEAVNTSARFDSHPMQDAASEDKLNYLKALSLMIHADEKRHEAEVAFFGALFRTLNPGDTSLERLLAFAENPDFADTQAIMTTLRRQEQIGIAFLMDLVMLAAVDGEINDREKALIGICRGFLGWVSSNYFRWYMCCEMVATSTGETVEEWLSVLPYKCTDHILLHRGLKRSSIGSSWEDWNKEQLWSDLAQKLPKKISEGLFEWHSLMEEELALSLQQFKGKSMATKVKSAIESVAVLSAHPLKEAKLEDKMNYLKVLSLVMAADEKIVAEEEAYFGAVTRTLIGGDMLQALIEYAHNPDFSEVTDMVATMAKSDDYKISLILDAAMLAHADRQLHQDEKDLITQLRDIVGWDHDKFDYIYRTSSAIVTESEGDLLNDLLCDVPPKLTEHLLEYRGVQRSSATNFSTLGIKFENVGYMGFGELLNSKKISKTPITLKQFYPFLQYIGSLYGFKTENEVLKFSSGEEIVSLGKNGLTLTDNRLSYSPQKIGTIIGISPMAGDLFCSWLYRFDEKRYAIPDVKGQGNHLVTDFASSSNYLIRVGNNVLKTGSGSFIQLDKLQPLDPNKIADDAILYIVLVDNLSKNNSRTEDGTFFGFVSAVVDSYKGAR